MVTCSFIENNVDIFWHIHILAVSPFALRYVEIPLRYVRQNIRWWRSCQWSQFYSGAPAAIPIVFVWSSSSAATDSRAPTYVRTTTTTKTESRKMAPILVNLYIPYILKSIDSCQTRYPLTSITWPYRELRLELIEIKVFLKLTADQLTAFHWIAGSSIFKNY